MRGAPRNRKAFLAAYSECGVISHAAKAAGISPRRHYEWMDSEKYRKRFDEAHQRAIDSLEAEARRRAVEGVRQDVFYQGEKCGEKEIYSDSLLMFLLKGALPDKYADRKQISGKDGGPLEISEEIVFVTDENDDSGLF